MKPITLQLNLTIDANALVDVLALAIERGTSGCARAIGEENKQRAAASVAPPPVVQAPPPPPVVEVPAPHAEGLIDVITVAELLGVSPRTVRRLVDTGKLPPPVRLGSLLRWRLTVIEEWIEAGCKAVERRGVPRSRK